MKKIELQQVEHNVKANDTCPYYEANVTEDCIFMSEGKPIGFYIKDVDKYNKQLTKLLIVANTEFRSNRVPKSVMQRTSGVKQYSTILGGIIPRYSRRDATTSSVHRSETAKTFIKAMLGCVKIGEQLIKEITPEIYEKQQEIFKDVDDNYKLGTMYTSSISNFNIPANFHTDTGNLRDTVNIIYTKRLNSTGGSLHVPDYNATIEQADNSMLVYPAWRNMHGVTPINQLASNGYRNSLVFYPLKYFKNNGQ